MSKKLLIPSLVAALTAFSECTRVRHRQPSLQIAGDLVHGSALRSERESGPVLKLKQDYPWYQTGDEIHDELQELAGDCSGADFSLSFLSKTNRRQASPNDNVQLDLVHVRKRQRKRNRKAKALFVFGEHARELISPEVGLKFLQTLCGHSEDPDASDLVRRVMDTVDFVIVPNANPLSRKKVEAGEYCKRTNEDGVDLNRNWGDKHRENRTATKGSEMDPGSSGFSEPETQMLRDLILDESPDIFLSVHSGAYLLATPFGYSSSQKAPNEKAMLDVLQPISEKYCDGGCPFGPLGELLSYQSKGCDLDWVSENLRTPFAFTWEIYAGDNMRGYYIADAHSRAKNRTSAKPAEEQDTAPLDLLQNGARPRGLRGHAASKIPGLNAFSADTEPESQQNPKKCFHQFNPESQEEFEEVMQKWPLAFLTLADEVSLKM